MVEILSLLWGSLLMSLATYWILRADERGLKAQGAADALRRIWPPASFWIAVVVFPGIAVLVHYWRTRRFSMLGTVLGITLFLALIFGTFLSAFVIEWACRDPRYVGTVELLSPLLGTALTLALQRSRPFRRFARVEPNRQD